MTSPSRPSLHAAATSYAAAGWPVLPLAPRAKTPLTSRGLLQATDNPNQIDWWWEQTPDANIGLRTGVAFDVLDIDGPEGLASLAKIAPGYKHEGPVSATGKGYHLLFAVTGKANFTNPISKESTAAPGIDFRGQNGYIVAAPSIHPDGHQYSWVRPVSLALPVAPAWLMDLFPKPLERNAPATVTATVQTAVGMLDLVEEFARIGVQLKPMGGGKLKGACPFHKDDTPSLVIYLDTDSFFCFGCREWGDALNVRRFAMTGRLR